MNRRSFFGLLIAAICGPSVTKHLPDWFRIETNPADLYQVPNPGLFGLQYYNVGGNLGNYMGIARSAYPGKFSTPTINISNVQIDWQSLVNHELLRIRKPGSFLTYIEREAQIAA